MAHQHYKRRTALISMKVALYRLDETDKELFAIFWLPSFSHASITDLGV